MKKNLIKLCVAFFIVFLAGLLWFGYDYVRIYFKNNTETNEDIKKAKPSPTPTYPLEYNLSLIATGDALIHDAVYNDAKKSDGSYDFTHQVTMIKEIAQNYDLAYYNQETIFGGAELGYSNYPRFNTPSEFGDAMIDAGFNLVSLANNHSYDKGEKGVLNAVDYWQGKENIFWTGIAASKEMRDEVKIKEKNNISYTMLSYTTLTNGLNAPSDKQYLVNVYNKEQVRKDIDALRNKVDVLIVAMHWGTEYVHNPTAEQLEIAQYLADLGVDIIIGTHSHVIQPVAKIGNTLVIYSLGNFISAQIGIERLVGMMVSTNIKKIVYEDRSEIEIATPEVELLYTYKNSRYRQYEIVPWSKMEDKYLSNHQGVYEKFKEIVLMADKNIIVK